MGTLNPTPKPIEIERLGEAGIRILWNDGKLQEIGSDPLRRACPCAECREQRGDLSHDAPLIQKRPSSLRIVEATVDEATRLKQIWAIGNYALGMRWGDGHQTGIYPYRLLRGLGQLRSDREASEEVPGRLMHENESV